jgi:plasmid maintenance system antidote protein VapI
MCKRNNLFLDELEVVRVPINVDRQLQLAQSLHAENVGVRKVLVRRRDVTLDLAIRILKM